MLRGLKWVFVISIFTASLLLIKQVSGFSKAIVLNRAYVTIITPNQALISAADSSTIKVKRGGNDKKADISVTNRKSNYIAVFPGLQLYNSNGITITTDGGIFASGVTQLLPIRIVASSNAPLGSYNVNVTYPFIWFGGSANIPGVVKVTVER